MKDIYDGELIHVWEHDNNTYMQVDNITIEQPNELWQYIIEDMKRMIQCKTNKKRHIKKKYS